MTFRSDRARRRATRRRNQRVFTIAAIVLVLGVIGFFVFNALNGNPNPPAANDPGASEGALSATPGANATTTASGLIVETLEAGSSEDTAAPGDTVFVHYTGWLTDGTKFDSSVDRNSPLSFVLGQGRVIAGWDEGVAGMQIGEVRKLIIPPDLAYREAGAPPAIPPNATLVFQVELLGIE